MRFVGTSFAAAGLGCLARNNWLPLLPALLRYLTFQYNCTALVYLLGLYSFPRRGEVDLVYCI